MRSPSDKANVECKNLAKLVWIQINSSAWGSPALHFFFTSVTRRPPALNRRPSWPHYFYSARLFWVENRDFLQSTSLWPHIRLQTISPCNIYCGLQRCSNEHRGMVLRAKWDQSRALIAVRAVMMSRLKENSFGAKSLSILVTNLVIGTHTRKVVGVNTV